jgi:heme oxygenase
MSLKELTAEKHKLAEETAFMKAVFNKSLPLSLWHDFTYNKMLIYNAIETKARAEGYLDDLFGLERSYKLYQDYYEMTQGRIHYKWRQPCIEYHRYILDLQPGLVLAHLYTWHMGDLYGGQMIKKLIKAPHRSLDFNNEEQLKTIIRSKLDDSLGDEANRAFDWAIKIMESYEQDMGQNS